MRNADSAGKSPPDAVLLRMGRSGWAWEWLRRNDRYRASGPVRAKVRKREAGLRSHVTIIEASAPASDTWGLCFAEDPRLPYQDAAVFWHPDLDAGVCPVAAVPLQNESDDGLFNLANLHVPAIVLVSDKGDEHLLLTDGLQSLQFHIVEGSLLRGPVRLAHVLGDFEKLHDHTLTIERLGIVLQQQCFPPALFSTERNATRWALTLHAIELEDAGMSHAEIADQLYEGQDGQAFATDWRRSRVRRLLEAGRLLINGGYRHILLANGKARKKD